MFGLSSFGTQVSADSYWLDADDPDARPPDVASLPRPRYPNELRETGASGFAWVRYIIGQRGRAEAGSLQVIGASHAAFGRAALDAIRRGVYRPGQYQGRPVRTAGRLPFTTTRVLAALKA